MSDMSSSELFVRALTMGREWVEHAKCRKLDKPVKERVALFFPSQGGHLKRMNEAKSICSNCPVKKECLAYSFETNSQYGIWGGEIKRRTDPPDSP